MQTSKPLVTLGLALSLGLPVFASSGDDEWDRAANNKKQFCEGVNDPLYFMKLSTDPINRIQFRNVGGPLNTGMCWWHARLQRSSLYLGVFRPELPKPSTREEARKIIDAFAQKKGVVEVPGYKNMRAFSVDWRDEIEDYLGDWQKKDLFLYQKWAKTLRSSKNSKEAMKKKMDELYDRVVNKNEITFMIIKFPGGMGKNHAVMVSGMKKVGDGYDVRYIDSNYPQDNITYKYRYDNPEFEVAVGKGAPYIGETGEIGTLRRRATQYCAAPAGREALEDY